VGAGYKTRMGRGSRQGQGGIGGNLKTEDQLTEVRRILSKKSQKLHRGQSSWQKKKKKMLTSTASQIRLEYWRKGPEQKGENAKKGDS